MSPRPCGPQPMTPTVMRLLGAVAPSLPSADAGMIVGKPTTAVSAVVPRNSRRFHERVALGGDVSGVDMTCWLSGWNAA